MDNVAQLVTIDRVGLGEHVAPLPAYLMSEVDPGLRRVLREGAPPPHPLIGDVP